jgi:hypothetical protein
MEHRKTGFSYHIAMKLLPYQRVCFKSKLKPDEIRGILSALVSRPDWSISVGKIVNNRVLIGKISNELFTIVMGRYGLSYGITSLLPIMKGKVKGNGIEGSMVDVTIRPLKAGIFILGFFYMLAVLGLYFSITKSLPQVLIVCCVLIVITYYSLMTKFNREAKVYRSIIDTHLAPVTLDETV